MNCPSCNAPLLAENLNISTDTGLCSACNSVFKVSKLIHQVVDSKFDIKQNPKGTWILTELNSLVLGGSTRSWMAFFLVPFMIVWSSLSIGGTAFMAFSEEQVDWFMVLFSIPFIIGAVIFWSIAMMFIWGKVEVTLNKSGGRVFTGVGAIGWSKSFAWSEIARAGITPQYRTVKGLSGGGLFLEGPNKKIEFGSFLSSDKKEYFEKAMNLAINKIKNDNRLF